MVGLEDQCDIIGHVLVTIFVVSIYLIVKLSYDGLRQWRARVNVVVIGCGPVGLTSALIAAKCHKVSSVILIEEKTRSEIFSRSHQIAFNVASIDFLKASGVDFDNIEGCWDKSGLFYTRIGVFLEYMLGRLTRVDKDVEIFLGTKFSRKLHERIEDPWKRAVFIVCDGSTGRSARIMGMSDEFVNETCKSYGAVAAIERADLQQIPTADIRIHNLIIDLSAYNTEFLKAKPSRFHLKIFGTYRNRYMSIACPLNSDSYYLKLLRTLQDMNIVKSIFKQSYNKYRTETEPDITDKNLRQLRCSRRMYEVKLSYRREAAVLIEDINTVATVEGDAARTLNFNSGMGVNLGIRGLNTLDGFLIDVAVADSMATLMEVLQRKVRRDLKLTKEFTETGFPSTMYC